jgi:uncharacterized protein
MNKKTLVIGASIKPERYSNKATKMLLEHGHSVRLLGIKEGIIYDKTIETEKRKFKEIDTVTLYVGPDLQPSYYEYIIGLAPKRVIFNPGTENPAFYSMLAEKNILAEEACTLVLLQTGQY